MRWLLLILALVTILIAGGFIALNIVKNNSLTLFENIGFTTLTYHASQESLGGVQFNNITLDKDGISTIETILTSFALNGESNILIKNPNLTADMLNGFALDGFNTNNFPYNLANLNINTAIIKNANLAILTKDMGGLTATIEARANKTDNGLTYQTRLTSAQQQFTIKAQATGTITLNSWNASGDIEQAKFDLPQLHSKITRAHGKFTASGIPQTPTTATIELNAGGYQLFNTPWKNAKATLKIKGNQKHLDLHATSVGKKPFTLWLVAKTGKQNTHITADINVPDKEALFSYLERHKKYKLLQHLKEMKNFPDHYVSLKLEYNTDNNAPKVSISITSDNEIPSSSSISKEDLL